MPSSDVSVMLASSASSAGPLAAPGRSGASWRARASAWASENESGVPIRVATSLPMRSRVMRSTWSLATFSRSMLASAVGATVPVRSMTATPEIPSAAI